MPKTRLLDMLKKGPVLGDGGYVWLLEKRGYVLAGSWTPEVVLEHPEAVKEVHREFARSGCDVLQAFTFYSNSGKVSRTGSSKIYSTEDLNHQACQLAKSVADEYGGLLVCGGLSPTPSFLTSNRDKTVVQNEFRKQCKIFEENEVDFMLGEFFGTVLEAEWATEVMRETLHIPVAINLRMGPTGDNDNVSPQECAIRLAKSGAEVIGINCKFDPNTALKTIKLMEDALKEADLYDKIYLMCQPVGIHCPEVENIKDGYANLPDMPFAYEHRCINRLDARNFARRAYDMGVRYIGGCCGFEPYHIREMAAELENVRERPMPGHSKISHFGEALRDPFNNPLWCKRHTEKHWRDVHKTLKYHVLREGEEGSSSNKDDEEKK